MGAPSGAEGGEWNLATEDPKGIHIFATAWSGPLRISL
jgi:hypothetical protein